MSTLSCNTTAKSSILSIALLAAVSAGSAGCAAHSPGVPTEQELRLKPASMLVNRSVETEVLIRFVPPSDLSISELKYRLDQGSWVLQKDPAAGWKILTKTLAIGDHVVEMESKANGKMHLVGDFNIKVFENEDDTYTFGKDPQEDSSTPKARVVIVI